ncbi:SDR family NAD(P)-dependent oxidoreductase [Candidatus Neomarinimicrobiota bacterium]
MNLAGQTVMVTGASGAVGKVIVDYHGKKAAQVISVVRGYSVDWERLNPQHSKVICDLSDRNAVMNLIALIWKNAGSCHAAVNTAGGFSMGGSVDEAAPDQWANMWQINFLTALHVCAAVLPRFKAQGFGRIINFGSAAGDTGMRMAGPYAASKAAVHNLTLTLAAEGNAGITANLIVPSLIDTPANRKAIPGASVASWTKPIEIAETVARILNQEDDPPNGQRYES